MHQCKLGFGVEKKYCWHLQREHDNQTVCEVGTQRFLQLILLCFVEANFFSHVLITYLFVKKEICFFR